MPERESVSAPRMAVDQTAVRAHVARMQEANARLALAEDHRRAAVADARADGLSWGVIGAALGISKQGAQKVYGPTSPEPERKLPKNGAAGRADIAEWKMPPAAAAIVAEVESATKDADGLVHEATTLDVPAEEPSPISSRCRNRHHRDCKGCGCRCHQP